MRTIAGHPYAKQNNEYIALREEYEVTRHNLEKLTHTMEIVAREALRIADEAGEIAVKVSPLHLQEREISSFLNQVRRKLTRYGLATLRK